MKKQWSILKKVFKFMKKLKKIGRDHNNIKPKFIITWEIYL